jgi:hypothetical protein
LTYMNFSIQEKKFWREFVPMYRLLWLMGEIHLCNGLENVIDDANLLRMKITRDEISTILGKHLDEFNTLEELVNFLKEKFSITTREFVSGEYWLNQGQLEDNEFLHVTEHIGVDLLRVYGKDAPKGIGSTKYTAYLDWMQFNYAFRDFLLQDIYFHQLFSWSKISRNQSDTLGFHSLKRLKRKQFEGYKLRAPVLLNQPVIGLETLNFDDEIVEILCPRICMVFKKMIGQLDGREIIVLITSYPRGRA